MDKFKAVIFDMDGILIDSEPYWEMADAELFRRHGKKHTSAINKHIMGMKPREIVVYFKKEYGFEATAEAILEERMALLYKFLLGNLTLMPGAKELIERLKEQNIPMAIATSGHTKKRAGEILQKLGLADYIKVIVVGDDVKNGKPAPDIFLKAAELLGSKPEDCLVYEDAPNGVMSGKAAGMTVYGINNDKQIRKKLEKVHADGVYRNLTEVTVPV